MPLSVSHQGSVRVLVALPRTLALRDHEVWTSNLVGLPDFWVSVPHFGFRLAFEDGEVTLPQVRIQNRCEPHLLAMTSAVCTARPRSLDGTP